MLYELLINLREYHFRYVLNVVAASFVALSTFCNVGVWFHVKNLKVFDDDEEPAKELQQIYNKEEHYIESKE